MPFSISDIKFRYSGGAANSLPNASLGGVMSSVAVVSQSASSPINITGLTVLTAVNNAQGVGLLSWSPSSNSLSWQPPGSPATYTTSGVTVNGTYTLGGSDGTLVVQVVYAAMASIYKQDSLTITLASQNVFDSVSPINSLVGSVEYRCLYISNTGTTTVNDVKVWIKTQTTGPDDLDIGLDPAGVGNGSTTGVAVVTALETAAPAGVVFTRPLTYATGLSVGTLAPGDGIALWERRTVPAGTTGNVTANTSTIGVALSV